MSYTKGSPTSDEISGVTKAAILLISLGPENHQKFLNI